MLGSFTVHISAQIPLEIESGKGLTWDAYYVKGPIEQEFFYKESKFWGYDDYKTDEYSTGIAYVLQLDYPTMIEIKAEFSNPAAYPAIMFNKYVV